MRAAAVLPLLRTLLPLAMRGSFSACNSTHVAHRQQASIEEEQHAQEGEQKAKRCEPQPDLCRTREGSSSSGGGCGGCWRTRALPCGAAASQPLTPLVVQP